MQKSMINRYVGMFLVFIIFLSSAGTRVEATQGVDGVTAVQSAKGLSPVVLVADPQVNMYHLPAFPIKEEMGSDASTATINIVFLPNGSHSELGDPPYPCYEWSTNARSAFEAAADIWETRISSSVPIEIHACWTELDPIYLGGSATDTYYKNFSGAPYWETWYSVSLANALSGSDLDISSPDIHHVYNRNFAWYFGTDGYTPGDKYDFMTTALHEIGHGLGFEGSMTIDGGYGYWGWAQTSEPEVFDRFTENGSGQTLLSFPNGSTSLGDQLTSNNVYFDGANANAANEGQRPKLYAPSTWKPGSSYSHLDEIFNNTPNALMTYSMGKGESLHDPGPVTMGILHDIGWSVPNTAPTLSGLPDQHVPMDTVGDNLIDLWAYASDEQESSSSLTYTIDNTPAAGAGVNIDGNRYVDVTPSSGWTGETEVRIRVTDWGGLYDTDTFNLTISVIWDGSAGSNWHTANNWTPSGVPVSTHLVTITDAANDPAISSAAAEVRDLDIQEGAVLDLTDQTLTVEGTLINHGTLKQTKEVSIGLTTEFLRIKDKLGLTTAYYGVDIKPDTITDESASAINDMSVTVSVAGNQYCSRLVPGVKRCYDVSPQDSLEATVRFYFTDAELNEHTLNRLLAFHLADGIWQEEPGPYDYPLIGDVYYVEVENVEDFSQFGLSEYALDEFVFLPLLQK
jgi:hypothetical protein